MKFDLYQRSRRRDWRWCKRTPKILICRKSGKNPWKSRQNPWKSRQRYFNTFVLIACKWCWPSKYVWDWLFFSKEKTWRQFWRSYMQTCSWCVTPKKCKRSSWIIFRTSWSKFGQKSFARPKILLAVTPMICRFSPSIMFPFYLSQFSQPLRPSFVESMYCFSSCCCCYWRKNTTSKQYGSIKVKHVVIWANKSLYLPQSRRHDFTALTERFLAKIWGSFVHHIAQCAHCTLSFVEFLPFLKAHKWSLPHSSWAFPANSLRLSSVRGPNEQMSLVYILP